MERLRQACASIFSANSHRDENTTSSSSGVLNIVVATSHAKRLHSSPIDIIDVGARGVVDEFYHAVCERSRQHGLLQDVLRTLEPPTTTVEEAQLTSHLLLVLSLPDRIAPHQEKLALSMDQTARQAYLTGMAVLVARRAVDEPAKYELWPFFCRLGCRRGYSDIVLSVMDDATTLPFQQELFLGICQALIDAPSKLANMIHKLLVLRPDPAIVLQCALEHHRSLCAPENVNSTSFRRVRVLQQVLFGVVVPQNEFPMSRHQLRRCIKGALFEGSIGGTTTPPCERCVQENRKLCVDRVAYAWNNAALHLQQVGDTEATGHALSYCLLCCQNNARELICGDVLSNILHGISKRFDLLRHRSLREEAARVATMYAEGYVAGDALPTFDEFPDALPKWLDAESKSADEMLLTKLHVPSSSARDPTNVLFAVETFSCAASLFPIDVDATVELLTVADAAKDPPPVVERTAATRDIDPSVAPFGFRGFKGTAGGLPCTLRQIYELLCVSPPNQSEAQRHEDVQRALHQISTALTCAGSQDVARNRSDATLIPKILHAVVHCDGDANLCRRAVVCCIVASPMQCLASIGDSFASNALSFVQQAELWSCIQDAAARLATLPSASPLATPHDCEPIRLYPPCHERRRNAELTASAGRVRWKSRRLSQHPATTHNGLVDVAEAFLSLAIASQRTNKMLPFVDLAMLRCLDTIMKLISPARHVAPLWAVRVVRFAVQFTTVESGETRGLAWALMWTAVESCSPSIHDCLWNDTLMVLLSAAIDDDPLVRPFQLRTAAAILQDTDP